MERMRRETKERGGIQNDKASKQTHKDKERARSWTDCNRTQCGKMNSSAKNRQKEDEAKGEGRTPRLAESTK